MENHTQGKWIFNGMATVSAGEKLVAVTAVSSKQTVLEIESPEIQRYNGHLISAAPELLEACVTAEKNLAPLYCSDHLVMRSLRAAIAKATGKPQ